MTDSRRFLCVTLPEISLLKQFLARLNAEKDRLHVAFSPLSVFWGSLSIFLEPLGGGDRPYRLSWIRPWGVEIPRHFSQTLEP